MGVKKGHRLLGAGLAVLASVPGCWNFRSGGLSGRPEASDAAPEPVDIDMAPADGRADDAPTMRGSSLDATMRDQAGRERAPPPPPPPDAAPVPPDAAMDLPPACNNACGGCRSLSAAPGASCGACGQYQCNGKEDVVCVDP